MEAFEPGRHGEHDFDVEGPLLTDVGGSLTTPVLATPAMIGQMEWAAANLVNPRLPGSSSTSRSWRAST